MNEILKETVDAKERKMEDLSQEANVSMKDLFKEQPRTWSDMIIGRP